MGGLVLTALGVMQALACVVPPATAFVSADDLVDRSPRIVLAVLEGVQSKREHLPVAPDRGRYPSVEFTFKVLEVLKGPAPKMSVLELERSHGRPGAAIDQDFDGHRDPRWGVQGDTRAEFLSNCAISADFRIGRTYLIFVGPPYHALSFEQIVGDDDFWLGEVRRLVRNSN